MRTLIVDDSKIARSIVKKHLEGTEAVIVGEASNGRDALALLTKGLDVDMVLTDRYMPEMDGLSLIRAIRGLSDHQNTFLVVVSSDGGWSQISEALEAGADEYLTKPFDTASLLSKLAHRSETTRS